AHNLPQLDVYVRRGNQMRLNGIDCELMNPKQLEKLLPGLDTSASARFPIIGGLMQRSAGTARHDAVVWAYARAADQLGVDIIENCEVTGFIKDGDKVTGVMTTRGPINAKKTACAVAGHTSELMRRAGVDRLPLESHVLQAFVSEALKPVVDTVATFGGGHLYFSQSDKGGLVFGGDI
ncbi:FAD-binding oxidoreductase, partial [Escherichia coli]|nr:FAD-binding oxidoreductase [Escherichia coli]